MTAAVTGATGFFGHFLLRRLVRQCDAVRTLFRRPEDEPRLRALGAVPVRGDLTVPGGCAGLVQPGDVVYHAAARVDITGPWQDFAATTIDGTRHLLDAALPQRPRRFVYISSAGVYVRRRAVGPVSADTSVARPSWYNLYGRAKVAAERLVRSACEQAGCPWVIVRLGFLYGPGNRALARHLVPLLKNKRLFVIGNGRNRIGSLYVEDAVDAVVLAGTHPAARGRVYDVVSQEHVTQRDFLDRTADALGLPRARRRVPYVVAMAATGLAELWAWLSGRDAPFTRAMVALMGVDQRVDTAPIQRELGWQPRVSFAEGMRRTQAWYHQHPAGE